MVNIDSTERRENRKFNKVYLNVYHCALKGNAHIPLRKFIEKLALADKQKPDIEFEVKTFSPKDHEDKRRPSEKTYWPVGFTVNKVNKDIADLLLITDNEELKTKVAMWFSDPIFSEIIPACADDEIKKCGIRKIGENKNFSQNLRLRLKELFAEINISFDEIVDEIFKKEIHILIRALDADYDPSQPDMFGKKLR